MSVQSAQREIQAVFRRANERLLYAVGETVHPERPIPFLCECLDPACRGTVQLTVRKFRRLRENPNRFAIVEGHPTMDGDRVVETSAAVAIVEKRD